MELNSDSPDTSELMPLVRGDGLTWREYRKTLRPRYAAVWRDIVLCWLGLISGLAAVMFVQERWGLVVGLAAVVPAAAWIAFWLHALSTYGHEASHDHLASSRRRNDLLADLCIWSLFGQTVDEYRRVHWEHHRRLGTHDDTEFSYRNCLSGWFIIKTLTGLHLVEVLLRHRSTAAAAGRETTTDRPERGSVRRSSRAVLRTAVIHGSIVLGTAYFGFVAAAAAWCVAVLLFFPFLATLRNLLEHRRLDADCAADFSQLEHGPVTRIFGDGPVTRWFGAAGFNRHLLHHWDPAIPYSRLPEMEQFLLQTPLAERLEACRSTYLAAARTLLQSARRRQDT